MHLKREEFISAWRSGAAILLPLLLALFGFLANILQVKSSGGAWAWIALAFAGSIILAIFLFARPLLHKTFRGSWLFQAVRESGLVDVEDRSNRLMRLPPAQVFNLRHIRYIMITGILDQVFQNFREDVRSFILRGGEVYVLILHPEEMPHFLANSWVQPRKDWISYWNTNINEAQIAVDAIVEAELDQLPGFNLRFMRQLPPYFGILAGDSSPSEGFNSKSFVRVQPLTFSQYVGRGVVFTLNKVSASDRSAFQYFADDFLCQWDVAFDDERFIGERRKALRTNI